MNKGLVSIITPCYNGEEYLEEYFDSILKQSYKYIELFFIDDGSTDRTSEIALSYKTKLEERGISYKYIYQDNSGQAAAINRALPLVSGEFLTWPDSDDILYPDSIKERVEFLNENVKYALVRNSVREVDFDSKEKINEFIVNNDSNEFIFEDLIFGKNVFYAPISYMIRTEEFFRINPNKQIYVTRYGQNWQMLLPITHKNKCGNISKILCDYMVRKNSHSRIKYRTLDEELFKYDKQKEILENVLSQMEVYSFYEKRIMDRFNLMKMRTSLSYNNKNKAKYFSNLLMDTKGLGKIDKIKIKICNNFLLFYLYRIIKYILRGKKND